MSDYPSSGSKCFRPRQRVFIGKRSDCRIQQEAHAGHHQSNRRHTLFSIGLHLRPVYDADGYCSLSTLTGLILIALTAGSRQANNEAIPSTRRVKPIVIGSYADTPYSSASINRASNSAAKIPIVKPTATGHSPCSTTSFTTLRACAPNAILIPISRVFW